MNISLKRLILLLALITLLLVGGVMYKIGGPDDGDGASQITNFKECTQAGYPVMESYPRQCKTPDGKTFTEDVENKDDKSNLIRVSSPKPNEEIRSPLVIMGEARGTWYFEASFPVVLTDWDGRIIAEGYAEALSEWMTEDFVPFRANLTFDAPAYKNYGTLILRKDNPSGLSEHDDAIEIPVIFHDTPKKTEEVTETGRERGGCMITGCSGQICGENDVITTCEYRPEYACYESAVCERQGDGQCGWSLTAAVGRCLQEISSGGDVGKQLAE